MEWIARLLRLQQSLIQSIVFIVPILRRATLKPGQILFQVVSVETSASTPLAEGKMVTVTLTLDAGPEDLKVRQNQGIQALRRHRMQRVCVEAFQQGGVLTIEDLANRLFNCGQRTLSRDLEAFRQQGIVLPLRSTI
ncbi:MAG: DUF1670 domain-containing protein, partial [Deltaproteobacteria bacterium]|nr:DUF1670 domain-containing protein [Deltaproteobacteria bacterium]